MGTLVELHPFEDLLVISPVFGLLAFHPYVLFNHVIALRVPPQTSCRIHETGKLVYLQVTSPLSKQYYWTAEIVDEELN